MCTEYILEGETLRSLGDLRTALRREPIYAQGTGCDVTTRPDTCLCSVDCAETAALIGRIPEWNDWGMIVFLPVPVIAHINRR